MQRNTRWIGLYTAVLCVAGFGPARADITAVLPPAGGTVGTQITLMGSGFGDRRGKVQLGAEACKILSWGDTIITCEVVTPQPAGDYTVTLSPQGGNQGNKKSPQPMTFSSFSMRAPQITPGTPLRLVAPGEQVTIGGAFFGDKKGEVYLHDAPGQTVAAKVRHWSMDSISFEIPNGLTGTLILGVKNAVGFDLCRQWGTFTPLPPGATGQVNLDLYWAHNNTAGVYYNGDVWLFCIENDLKHNVTVKILGTNGWDYYYAPNVDARSDAQVSPIVIEHELWMFQTGQDGHIYYFRYDPVTAKWHSSVRLPDTITTKSNFEMAPVYNPIKQRIEVYYWYDNTVYWVYSDNKGASWSAPRQVGNVLYASTAPSAVFYQTDETTGKTLLAVGGNYPQVYFVQDGSAAYFNQPYGYAIDCRPFLADLGEDYFVLLWRDPANDLVWANKMDKHANALWSGSPYHPLADATCWAPSGVVRYEEKSASTSLGCRWDAVFYVLWGEQLGNKKSWASSVETVGSWKEVDPPTTNNFTADPATTFQLWPVIGVVDAPPFVINGDPDWVDEDVPNPSLVTRVEFGNATETNSLCTTKASLGCFVATGEKSPLKIELSASVAEEKKTEKSCTVMYGDTLTRSTNGTVMVYYLAPELVTHKLQWYNPNETTNYMYPILMGSASTVVKRFKPTEFPYTNALGLTEPYFDSRLPVHAAVDDAQRLRSYMTPPPGNYLVPQTFKNWDNGDSHFGWVTAGTSSTNYSSTVEFKVSGTIKELLGIGVNGSFEMSTETKTSVTTEAIVYLTNPLGPIGTFNVYGRWLAPDANGLWVPRNRQAMGDTPWFITYYIDYWGP